MQINITRKSAGLSASLRAYIESKLETLEERFHKVDGAKVLISEHGKNNCVEINLHVTGVNLFAKDQSLNFRSAFDSCIDKLERQLSRRKDKIRRKTLTQKEVLLNGKVYARSDPELESRDNPDQPILILEPEDETDEPEQRTGT